MVEFSMIPESILAKGDRAALEYLLESTALGSFVQKEAVRRAIAEDIILDQFKEFVFTALFIDSPEVQAQWKIKRPDAAMMALRLAQNELSAYKALHESAYELRLRLRLSAYRKIDIWWCGKEIFTPHELLGAEPYFTITLPGYEANPVKIGKISSASYHSDPKTDAVALEMMQKEELLDPIEKALFPLLPPEGSHAIREWGELQSVLIATEPFKEFSRTHKLPCFPKSLIVDPQAIPEGFLPRFTSENGTWSTLYSIGISPIISKPAAEYLKNKQKAIAAVMERKEALMAHLSNSIEFNNHL